MNSSPVFIFAGGGSGGHIMPSLAVLERLRERHASIAAEAMFLCSDKPLDAAILSAAGVSFRALPARPPALRPFPAAPIRFARGWGAAVAMARRTISDVAGSGRRPILVAMGGYSAAPAARAASLARAPILLVNLDVEPGRSNQWMARRATSIITAVPVAGRRRDFGEAVGMPIRRSAIADRPPDRCRAELGLDPPLRTMLITGASQGAGSLNRFMPRFAERERAALDGWQILHLAGPGQEASIRAMYASAAFDRAVVLAFCDCMGLAWGASDLAISRAGASSVAEAAANATPTIFVPYPHHRDEHQRLNAEPLARRGAAWIARDEIDDEANLRSIGSVLLETLRHPERLDAARRELRSTPAPDGAAAIADRLVQLSGG